MLFYIASALTIIAGFYVFIDEKKSFYTYLIILAIIPTGTAYGDSIQKNGILFYDWYFAILILYFILKHKVLEVKQDNKIIGMLVFCIILCAYFFYGAVANDLTKYYLKDVRPIIVMVGIALMLLMLKSITSQIKEKDFYIFTILFSIFNFLDSWLLISGVASTGDQFYLDNNYRYLDSGTYFAAIFLISLFARKQKSAEIKWWLCVAAVILSISCLLLSNSRFLILATSIAILYLVRKKVIPLIKVSIFIIFSAMAFYQLSEYVGASRIIDGMTYDGMMYQINTRFSPALAAIESMSMLEIIFGKGPGYFFEIPWFYYRELDVNNVNIDSTYLTLYVKYGFFSAAVIYYFTNAILSQVEGDFKIAVIIFLGIIFLVSAVPYQPYIIGLIAAPLASIISQTTNKNK